MEHQNMLNLNNEINDSKFVTRKWNNVNDNSKSSYDTTNEITYNTEILKSNLCDYNNVYILVRGDITVVAVLATQVAFKNCAPFSKCITKIDETITDGVWNLDLVIAMCNLIEYSSKYSKRTGTLWFYSKDKTVNFNADIANDDNFKSFKYKAKLLGNTAAEPVPIAANVFSRNATIAVPLKYLSSFWRSLEISLINSKVELKCS